MLMPNLNNYPSLAKQIRRCWPTQIEGTHEKDCSGKERKNCHQSQSASHNRTTVFTVQGGERVQGSHTRIPSSWAPRNGYEVGGH